MYEKIVKIMEKSKGEQKDIGVAYDMLVNENPDADLKEAFEFYKKYYFDISKLRQAGKMELVKELCDIKDEKEIDAYIEKLKENGVIS